MGRAPQWRRATVERVGHIRRVQEAVRALKGGDLRWKEGWAVNNPSVSSTFASPSSSSSSSFSSSAAFVALLRVISS